MIEIVRLVEFVFGLNLFNNKSTHFVELIIILGVLWDPITLFHDINHRKPKSHASTWENLLIMAQIRCQVSSWSHGHPKTSPETRYYTSLALQSIGQTKPKTFHDFRDVSSWMSGMNYQKWKMNFEFWPWFFLWAKIFVYPMFTQILKKIEQKGAVIQLIESRRKSQNHAWAFSQLQRDLVLQFHFYGVHWKDKFKPKKNSTMMEN